MTQVDILETLPREHISLSGCRQHGLYQKKLEINQMPNNRTTGKYLHSGILYR